MNRNILIFVLLALLLALPAFAQKPSDDAEEVFVGLPKLPQKSALTVLDEALYGWSAFALDTRAINAHVRRHGRLNLHLGNQLFDLVLEQNDLRAPDYRQILMIDGRAVEQEPGPVITFKGHLESDPAAIVRLTIDRTRFEGYVKTDEDWTFIDTLTDYSKSARRGEVVVYDESQLRHSPGTCGSDHNHNVTAGLGQSLIQNQGLGGLEIGHLKAANNLRVAAECDGQYYSSYGNPGSFNRMTSVLNGVDGIYESQINTSITIGAQQCWTNASTDPYTSLNAETTLNQFRSYWQSNMGGTSRDTAHQFSGKNFSGGTIGIAWVGVICNRPDLSYGVSQDLSSSGQRNRLTAHEIGHNLSAGHDNQSPVCSGVSCSGSGPIMCSAIQPSGPNTFSSCSKSSIASHISTYGSCL